MFERLAQIEIRYEEIESEMAKPETLANMEEYKKLAKERTEIKDVVDIYREWKKKQSELAKAGELFKTETDEDIKTLAREEIAMLEETTGKQEAMLREKLLGKNEKQAKSIFLEIRAGTGGEEAALFARDLFTMYMRYAETMRWKTELMSTSISDLGGFREVIMVIEGKGCLEHASARKRCPQGPKSSRHRSAGENPHINGNRCGAAGTRRAGVQHKPRRDTYRCFSKQRTGGAARKHNRLGSARYTYTHRHGGYLPGRKITAQEQSKSHEGPARPPERKDGKRQRAGNLTREKKTGGYR